MVIFFNLREGVVVFEFSLSQISTIYILDLTTIFHYLLVEIRLDSSQSQIQTRSIRSEGIGVQKNMDHKGSLCSKGLFRAYYAQLYSVKFWNLFQKTSMEP